MLASSVIAIPRPQGDPSGQPDCVQLCVRVKFEEASEGIHQTSSSTLAYCGCLGYLAPDCDATDVACLCSTSSFTQAYANCLSDNVGRSDHLAYCYAEAFLVTYSALLEI